MPDGRRIDGRVAASLPAGMRGGLALPAMLSACIGVQLLALLAAA
jgi:hypothetical protein